MLAWTPRHDKRHACGDGAGDSQMPCLRVDTNAMLARTRSNTDAAAAKMLRRFTATFTAGSCPFPTRYAGAFLTRYTREKKLTDTLRAGITNTYTRGEFRHVNARARVRVRALAFSFAALMRLFPLAYCDLL